MFGNNWFIIYIVSSLCTYCNSELHRNITKLIICIGPQLLIAIHFDIPSFLSRFLVFATFLLRVNCGKILLFLRYPLSVVFRCFLIADFLGCSSQDDTRWRVNDSWLTKNFLNLFNASSYYPSIISIQFRLFEFSFLY